MAVKTHLHLQRVVGDLSAKITSEPVGAVLPSLRKLSLEYHVSHETVRRALKVLEERGLVTKRHGLGTYVGRYPSEEESDAGTRLYAPHAVAATSRTLTFATCELTPEKRPVWDEVLTAFAANRPDIRVQLSPSRVSESAFTQQSPSPDVLHVAQYAIRDMAHRGLLLDLSPWTERHGWLDDALTADLTALCRGGVCYGVPVNFDTTFAFLRTDAIPDEERRHLLEHFDLEHLIDWALMSPAAATVKRPLALPVPHFLVSFEGIDPFDLTLYEPGDDHGDQLLYTLERLRHASARYDFYPHDVAGWDVARRSLDGFMSGQHLIIFHHSFILPEVIQQAGFAWQVWPQPSQPGQVVRPTTLSCAVPRTCRDVDAAVAFIDFLCGYEAQSILGRWKNNVPVLRSAVRSRAFRKGPPPGLDKVVDSITHTADRYEHGGVAFVRACTQIWDQQVMRCLRDEQSPADATEAILTGGRHLVHAFGLNSN